jgi:hypothetical protein
MLSGSFANDFHDNLINLKYGLVKWELVEFHKDVLGGYNARNLYFKEYVDYYLNVVPGALSHFIHMLTGRTRNGAFGHRSIFAEGNGTYCQYKNYFDYIYSMSRIHRCEVLHFYNDRCSNKDLRIFFETKILMKTAFEKNCWGKICRYLL